MYDKRRKIWVSDCDTPEKSELIKKSGTDDAQVSFLKASYMLAKINDGADVAQAVAVMEALAKKEHPEAMFSMGQMFSFGWGVNRDRKMAEQWYKKAAEAGYEPARRLFAERRRKRTVLVILSVLIAAVAAGAVAAIVYGLSKIPEAAQERTVYVHEDTELCQTMTVDEFTAQLQTLVAEYDDGLVISGQVGTNRVILKFEGNVLDLSAFPADKVIVRENNMVIIQFADEEEALRCLEVLKNQQGITFAEMDAYEVMDSSIDERYCELTPVYSSDMTADYMSWGVADMGLDVLSEYVRENYSDREVVVAVIDSGALVHSENAHRYIEGYNVATGGSVIPDRHGTHVTGTILDGADCDNIKVWNIDCYSYGYDSEGNYIYGSSISEVYNAYQIAIENKVDVINFSQGYPYHVQTLHEAVEEAVAAGVVVVQAAGNESCNTDKCTTCPSESSSHIVVGSYDKNHNFSYFTNYGISVDVCAPGEEIWSYSDEGDGRHAMLQGTSMASPHIAALAALLKCIKPDATPAQIEMYIKDYCRAFMNDGYSTGLYGAGAPDATAFAD